MNFKQYLAEEKRLSPSSIKSYTYILDRFSHWITQQGVSIERVTYTDLLQYIKARRGRREEKKYINQGLTVIRHYYAFLLHKGIIDYNPAINLVVRGVIRRLPHGLLDKEKLEELYQHYSGSLQSKVVLGLLVYQGLTTCELQQLRATHINLTLGMVQVPETARSNGRTLPLEASQVLPLQQFLASCHSSYLFASYKGSGLLTNVLSWLMLQLRKLNPAVKNAGQLRMSIITHWLKDKDVRVVQYLAGHRHVSSTQRYQQDRLRALQQDIEDFHPLG
ncbi:tyrosine-type recombinase/integrase [Pontibacter pudoricolor]|uniref:tyrosine-type recombinase/integrase n=1 Tax=Pontibacter pudoricolor TaxID=2694930 RepID=UPI001390F6C2|nr:tyrosine-type recombinase/integrase [Pontibacter pudoricolor]